MLILRSCLRLIVLLTIILTCLLLVLEFAVQIGSTKKFLSRGSFLGGADQYTVNPEWYRKFDKRNSIGHRDREYSINKPKDTFRIVVLGDSMTFGHGIKKLEDTWHEKLETLLNEDSKPVSFEVISLSINGWNTDSQLYELFRVGFEYSPDMILIGYYMNDVPVPTFFDCKYKETNFLPNLKVFSWIVNNSKAYDLIKFYGNRLLEQLGKKDSYETCLNQRYESRGWDMEEIYLDTIRMSAQIKNIHLMLATIPVINKLGNDYPLKNSHQKIKTYCTQNGIECLDLYEKGFKGLNAKLLRLANTDWHLNEAGNEIIAQTLFKRLKTLTKYKYLSSFSGAFNLNELLNQKRLVAELDNRFSEVKSKGGNIKIGIKDENLNVINKNETVQYIYTISNHNKSRVHKITLDSKGNFKESEVAFHKDNDHNTYFQSTKRINDNYFVRRWIKKESRSNIDERNYHFYRLKGKAPVISPDFDFYDPKIMETKIFNPTPDMLGPEAELSIYKGLNSFNEEVFYDVVWNKYFYKLAIEINKIKPSFTAMQVLKRIELENLD